MNEILEIFVVGILFLAATLPFVIAFDKAKKEMEAEESEDKDVLD